MDHKDCDHTNCQLATANRSVCQTLSEMDWERGIWNAAFNGDIDKVISLIDKARNPKDIVNAPDNSGYTALHYAARNGHVDICKILIQNGANVDAETHGKATPLHKAAAAGKASTIELLIQSGARVDTQDVDGQTVLHKAAANKHFNVIDGLLKTCPLLAEIKDFKGQLAIN